MLYDGADGEMRASTTLTQAILRDLSVKYNDQTPSIVTTALGFRVVYILDDDAKNPMKMLWYTFEDVKKLLDYYPDLKSQYLMELME